MVLMFVTDIDETLFRRILKSFKHQGRKMMVSRKLEPRGFEGPLWRKPRIHNYNRFISLDAKSGMS